MMAFRENEPLARYTSWKIGGPARYFAESATADELRAALAWARERGLPVHLLGGGTNTLVRDSGFPGLVLRYRAQGVRLEPRGDEARAIVEAGALTAGLARRLARQGWAGLHWAEGLPGTVGGALYGNAGCYGGDIAGALVRAWLLVDGAIDEWPAARMGYGYRTSVLKDRRWAAEDGGATTHNRRPMTDHRPPPVVVAAEFALTRADPEALAAEMARTAAARRSKTPAGQSCGSVFKNPPGDSAGRLIEAAGLKGRRIGGAEIAAKHGNYIVNRGGATSDDVLRLIDLVRGDVLRQFGVELELEVQILP
jgi:UDP-N-acetylmuramate dehydrogenase